MKPHIILSAITALFFIAAPASAQAVQTRTPIRSTTTGGAAGQQHVCRGATVPTGLIVTDDGRDRQMCGGDNQATFNAYNVWVIERFDNRAVGSVMEVCAAAPTPSGWVLVDIFRLKEKCGHPEDVFAVNMKRIRRTQ
jgi:hypothetical protein